jgi:hypothetical protein
MGDELGVPDKLSDWDPAIAMKKRAQNQNVLRDLDEGMITRMFNAADAEPVILDDDQKKEMEQNEFYASRFNRKNREEATRNKKKPKPARRLNAAERKRAERRRKKPVTMVARRASEILFGQNKQIMVRSGSNSASVHNRHACGERNEDDDGWDEERGVIVRRRRRLFPNLGGSMRACLPKSIQEDLEYAADTKRRNKEAAMKNQRRKEVSDAATRERTHFDKAQNTEEATMKKAKMKTMKKTNEQLREEDASRQCSALVLAKQRQEAREGSARTDALLASVSTPGGEEEDDGLDVIKL